MTLISRDCCPYLDDFEPDYLNPGAAAVRLGLVIRYRGILPALLQTKTTTRLQRKLSPSTILTMTPMRIMMGITTRIMMRITTRITRKITTRTTMRSTIRGPPPCPLMVRHQRKMCPPTGGRWSVRSTRYLSLLAIRESRTSSTTSKRLRWFSRQGRPWLVTGFALG